MVKKILVQGKEAKVESKIIPLEKLTGILKGPLSSRELITEARENESKFDEK